MTDPIDWVFAKRWHVALLIAVLLGALVLANWTDERECDKLRRLAPTAHDSLQAEIACREIHDRTALGLSIGLGAGVVAGSRR